MNILDIVKMITNRIEELKISAIDDTQTNTLTPHPDEDEQLDITGNCIESKEENDL